ncbi:hypothetical protein HDV04_003486 [Boothiomyces sp. JEL0838]|nr:hypothetical protein HDV04_003486 [Boothiomyces sp. JEL0838]
MILLNEIRTNNRIQIYPGIFKYELEISDLVSMLSKYNDCQQLILVMDWYVLGNEELQIISRFNLKKLVLHGIENKKVLKGFSSKTIKKFYNFNLDYLHLDCYGLSFKRILPFLSIKELSLCNLKEIDLDQITCSKLTVYFRKINIYRLDPILMMNILISNQARIEPEIRGRFTGLEIKLVYQEPEFLYSLAEKLGLRVKKPLDMLQQLSDFYRDNSELYSSFDINSYEQLTASEMAQFVLSVPQKLDVVLEDKSLEITPLGSFEIWSTDQTPPPKFITRKTVVTRKEFYSWFDSFGKLQVPIEQVEYRIFSGGLDSSIRGECFKFLLGVYPWSSTTAERNTYREINKSTYSRYKLQWQSILQQKTNYLYSQYQENLFRIEKDVVRTDRNHSFYPSIETSDPSEMISKCQKMGLLRDILMTFTSSFPNNEPGFVQGMADLCSPLLIHIEDESEAFWCFAGLMNKKKENFNNDGAGIKRQLELLRKLLKVMDLPLYTKLNEIGSMNLFCAFRWILVLFKREFPFEQTMKLWDACFSNYYSTDFHIFICLTIFETYRNEIIGHIEDTDELLCFIHGLSNKMDSDAILASAEDLFLQFKKICKAQGCLQEGRLDLEKVLGSF